MSQEQESTRGRAALGKLQDLIQTVPSVWCHWHDQPQTTLLKRGNRETRLLWKVVSRIFVAFLCSLSVLLYTING